MNNVLIAADAVNPLLPAGYDIAWTSLVLLVIIGAIVALVVISRNRNRMSGPELALWIAIVLFLPIVGPAVWFAIGHRRMRSEERERPT